MFTKQEAKLVTYVAGPVKSTVDYIMVRQEDKAKVCNVKVISSEECVPKHKLLVMDMWFKATKSWHRKFEPRVCVWKLKEEKTCEEYRCIVGDKVEEATMQTATEADATRDDLQPDWNRQADDALSKQRRCPETRLVSNDDALRRAW